MKYGVVEFIVGKQANNYEFKTNNLDEAVKYAKEGSQFGTIHLVKDINSDEIVFEAKPNA
jgi:hypothetical protein